MLHFWVLLGSLIGLTAFGAEDRPKLCAALRGNGNYIFTHFAALARLTETYGTFDGLSGGSSGSVTAFLYESMLLNPAVSQCGGARRCTPEERSRRVSFLLKSMDGYLEALKDTPEASAILGLGRLYERAVEEGIQVLLDKGAVSEASQRLKVLLENDSIRGLVNPKIWEMLKNGRGIEVFDQIKNFGKFEAKNPVIFFRPGLIDFDRFPEIIGLIADFYAGRGTMDPTRAMTRLLGRCATKETVGRWWGELDRLNCTDEFKRILARYRKKNDPQGDYQHRIQDPIGGKIPILVSTSIIDGEKAVKEWREDETKYLSDKTFHPSIRSHFSDVKYGYWGRPEDLNRIRTRFENTEDLKSRMFLPLGPKGESEVKWTPWAEALRTSPAEPGLSAIQPIDNRRASAGGWSDLQPVAVLKAMGCETVIYVTREGRESDFAVDVAKLLGMSDKENQALFEPGLQTDGRVSSFQKSIDMADGIWCTEWNRFTSAQVAEMTLNSFRSPLIVKDPKHWLWKTPPDLPGLDIRDASKAVGCRTTSIP